MTPKRDPKKQPYKDPYFPGEEEDFAKEGKKRTSNQARFRSRNAAESGKLRDLLNFLKARRLLVVEIAMTAALLVFIFCYTGRGVNPDASMTELAPSLIACLEDPDAMQEGDAMKLRAYYGLNANDYEETVLYIPASNMDAAELLLVKCKTEDQADAVAEAMEDRLADQTGKFESYGVEQMALISNAVIDTKGVYCLYACLSEADEVQDLFRKAIQ